MTKMRTEIKERSDFCRLHLNGDGKSMLLLGYREPLTAGEYAIIRILMGADSQVCRSHIADMTKIKETSIPVHISNINKKALPITGKKLIEGNRQGQYRIAEHI